MLTKYIKEVEIKEIIDNYHDSMENLVTHKQTITHLIGHLNQMKELYNLAQKERNDTVNFIESIFFEYNLLKSDERLISRIKAIDKEPILKREAKSVRNQYIQLSDGERAL